MKIVNDGDRGERTKGREREGGRERDMMESFIYKVLQHKRDRKEGGEKAKKRAGEK